MRAISKKYQPDLRSFMAVSASNYAKFLKLTPNIEQHQGLGLVAEFVIDKQPNLEVSLLQASRYTQTLAFKQSSAKLAMSRELCVRLYHDAQLAEVLSGLHDSMLPPVYKVPNSEMRQVDEKAQLNQFLGEWLNYCLENALLVDQYKNHLAFL